MKLTFNKVAEGTVALGLIFMFLCDAPIFHYLNEQIVLGTVFVQQPVNTVGDMYSGGPALRVSSSPYISLKKKTVVHPKA